MNILNRNSLSHLLIIIAGFVIISVFFAPLYSGKDLMQSDNIQLKGVNKEIAIFKEKGEQITWNPREFSGVPLLMSSPYNPFKFLNEIFFYSIGPKPVMMVLALFLGFYILLLVNGVSKWVSALGALAYAFSTFNIISVEVGHDNKVIAMAFMAPVLAGVMLAYNGKWLKGAVLTMISAGFELYYGHIQITYYLLLVVLAYVVLVLVKTYQSKEWNAFIRASGALAIATIIAVGCNFTKLYSTIEYADYSTRGGSDLTQQQGDNVSNDGLDKEYALSWSNGVLETFTLVFPYFHGGASGESLDIDSEVYKALSSRGVDQRTITSVTSNAPLYWGDQPFTGGPIYIGVIVCFLFVLSLFLLKGSLKYWGISVIVLSLLLAMGKNLEWFTDIFFYYVPLYNKFRSVTMILSVTQLIIPFMGFLTLSKLIEKTESFKKLDSRILQAAGVIAGIGIFFFVFKGAFFDFSGQNDQAYGFPDWLLVALKEDRKDLFNTSIIRGVIFVLLATGAIWLYLKKVIKLNYLLVGFAVLILIDLWVVDKRYLGADDFQTQRRMSQQMFQPTAADQRIAQDEGYFRVINLTSQNPFSDGLTAYHHYSILGYSAIKMQRYQELIDKYIRNMNNGVLSMLNTRYFITKGQNGQPIPQKNSSALGNAWLVESVTYVNGADEEYEKLGEIDPGSEAIVDKSRFGDSANENTYSAQGSIELSEYHPEKMTYTFSSQEPQVALFSEIYYEPGWNAYIDGQEVSYFRANYILRGIEVPAGEHEIVFRYEPFSSNGGQVVIWFSTLFLIGGIGYLGLQQYQKSKK